MLHLLEQLLPSYRKVFSKNVGWKEINVLSLQLSPRAAIVLTDCYLYLLKKGFWRISCKRIKKQQINECFLDSNSILVVRGQSGNSFQLAVDAKKKNLARDACEKILTKINS